MPQGKLMHNYMNHWCLPADGFSIVFAGKQVLPEMDLTSSTPSTADHRTILSLLTEIREVISRLRTQRAPYDTAIKSMSNLYYAVDNGLELMPWEVRLLKSLQENAKAYSNGEEVPSLLSTVLKP